MKNKAIITAVSLAVWGHAQAATPVIELAPEKVPAAQNSNDSMDISFGGYVKVSAMVSHYAEGDVSTPSAGRDFFRPNSIPTGNGDIHTFFDAHAKDTRLFTQIKGISAGHKVSARVEIDFRNSVGGNELISNSYNPRLRRAFVTVDNWLLGQEWSIFRNHASNPESLDSLGATDGLLFMRQPQVRYTGSNWAIALENPETTVLTNGGAGRVTTGDSVVPDLTARVKLGDVTVAGLVRQLSAEKLATGGAQNLDAQELGFGLSIAGKFNLGKDDIRFRVSGGEGIGRYVAIATAADAVETADGELDPIRVTNGLLAYRHIWSPRWRSTLAVSGFWADHDETHAGSSQTKSYQSVRANLIWAPSKKLLMGAELLFAERELDNGDDGTLSRLQFSTKYAF